MTGASEPGCVYHPAIDRLLTRLLGAPHTVADLRRTAEAPGCEPLAALLHDAALRAGERDRQLTRKINHMCSDLQAATQELTDARPAEHLLTGRHDELLTLAARHYDALTHLERSPKPTPPPAPRTAKRLASAPAPQITACWPARRAAWASAPITARPALNPAA